jgi:hypothetical protein
VTRDIGKINCDSGEQFWIGEKLTSMGPGPTKTFVFRSNLPTCMTTNHRVLIATEGFAALGLITPDYVIPNHFVQIPDGAVDLAGGSTVYYTALPNDGVTAIDASGKRIPNVATNLAGQSVSLTAVNPPATIDIVEYRHAEWDHYFITGIQDEITKLDNGTFAGWARTGYGFKSYPLNAPGSNVVCRFFSTSFAPRSSHFYTPFALECANVQANPDWQFEGPVFNIPVPDLSGACPAGTLPVYRLYNNGQGAAPNHRYTTDLGVRAQMIARDWVPEGYGALAVVMCAPS